MLKLFFLAMLGSGFGLSEALAQPTPAEERAVIIVLHIPQAYLSAGDTLFYKLYLISPISHALDPITKTVRVQLVDTKHQRAVSTQYLRVRRGLAYGSLALHDSLNFNNYSLIASILSGKYRYGQNIILNNNTTRKITQNETFASGPASQVLVHAEGGNLVLGLQTKLLIQTVDRNNNSTFGQGRIQEQSGETITTFSTDSLGQGICYLSPQAGSRYEALLDNTNQPTPLPDVQARGYTFSADYTTSLDSLFLYVDKSADIQPDTVTITGTLRGKQWYQARIPMRENNGFVGISKSLIPATGLLSFHLSDTNGKNRCERLLFHQAKPGILVSVVADKARYAMGERITLSVSAMDSLGRPTLANMSLAVVDSDTNYWPVTNMANRFTLCADVVQGCPDWLLTGASYTYSMAQVKRVNDWLIAQKEVLHSSLSKGVKGNKSARKTDKNGLLTVKGIVRTPFGKGATNASITLLGQRLPKPLHRTKTDSTGRFAFEGLDFEGPVEIVLSAKDDKQTVLTDIELLNDVEEQSLVSPGKEMLIDNAPVENPPAIREKVTYNQDVANAKQLEEVTVKAKKVSPLLGDTRRMLYGEPDIEILFDEKAYGYTSIRESIAGRVPGMTVSDTAFTVRGFTSGSRMMMMLDGIPSDYNAIMSLSPFDVRAVDVIKDPGKMGIFGSRGGSGVINVLTKRGEFVKSPARKEVVTRTIRGYEPTVEEQVVSNKNNLVYWNPGIDLEDKGPRTITFLAPSYPALLELTALITNGMGVFVEKKIYITVAAR